MKRWLARQLIKNDKSLIGFWPFQSNYLDCSGNVNHGNNGSQGIFACRSRKNGALVTNQVVVIPKIGKLLSVYKPFTYSFWFYMDNFVNNQDGYSGNETIPITFINQGGYNIYIGGDNFQNYLVMLFDIIGLDGFNYDIAGYYPINLRKNKWYHIALSYDGTGTISGMRAYINSLPITSYSGLDSGTNSIFRSGNDFIQNSNVYIGSDPNADKISNGVIGILRLWRRVVGPTEIARLYNEELDLFLPRKKYKPRHQKSSCNLYIGGQAIKKTLPLFVDAPPPPTGICTLFIHGYSCINNNIPMFIDGNGNLASGLPLYVHGGVPISGTLPLFIHGKYIAQSSMNLFLNNPTIQLAAPVLPLYVTGSASNALGGIQKTLDMYISGTGKPAGMNLYLKSVLSAPTSAHMNLFTSASPQAISAEVSLVVQNNQSGASTSLPFNINGGGLIPLPIASGTAVGMNLFLKRWPTDTMPMFISCASPNAGAADLYIEGTASQQNNIALCLLKVVGSGVQNTSLFVSGW